VNKRAAAIVMALAAISTIQLAASFAKSLFAETGPVTMVFLRQITAGVVLFLVLRPKPKGHSRRDWLVLGAYTALLVTMNFTIYMAMARIPVGIAVTIEFLGPFAVAVAKGRGWRDLVWAGLAAVGVVLLGWSPGELTWAGIAFAVAAGACWAGYILISPAVGRRWRGVDPVAYANLTGGLVFLAPALLLHSDVLARPEIWGFGLIVGVFSSVLPYSLELQALRHLEQRVFSVLMAAEPAVAAVTAWLMLGEALKVTDVVAIGCVMVASVGVTVGRRQ
jgi:inner membrane transporter RhtA